MLLCDRTQLKFIIYSSMVEKRKKVFIWPMSEASLRSPSIRAGAEERIEKCQKYTTHKIWHIV